MAVYDTQYTVGATAVPIQGKRQGAGMFVTPSAAVRIGGASVTASTGTPIAASERADVPFDGWYLISVSGSNVTVDVSVYGAPL